MPELKKFLNPMTSYQRILYTALFAFLCFGVFFFLFFGITSDFPFEMMLMPVGLFAAFGAFLCWMFMKAQHAYDNWWNSLSDAEHTEIEQEFRQATQVSHNLLAGPRYAFIRSSGRAFSYDKIEDIELRPGKNWRCSLCIHVKDAKAVHVYLSTFHAGEQLYDDLHSLRRQMNGKA